MLVSSIFNQNIFLLSIISINIVVYVLFTFVIFYLILVSLGVSKITAALRFLKNHTWFYFLFLTSLSSLAGLPPLFGFFTKWITFLCLFIHSEVILIFFYCFFNFFLLYFYLQLMRNSTGAVRAFVFKSKFSENFYIFGLSVIFFNFFGFFFIHDFVCVFLSLG